MSDQCSAHLERKLYDSAGEKQDSFKSLHGLLNLEKVFSIEDAPSIKPILKLNSEIIFSPRDGRFNLNFPIRNYGTKAKNVRVEVFFKDRRVKLKANSVLFKKIENYRVVQTQMVNRSEREGKPVPDPSIIRFKRLMSNRFIDCLLYTSPSPRDKRQSRMPSSA